MIRLMALPVILTRFDSKLPRKTKTKGPFHTRRTYDAAFQSRSTFHR